PPPPEGYAVIVWLHSGDFTVGNVSELNPFHLVLKQKLLVVTVAYRLGIFGFFTSMDFVAPGNFGLMDQSAALLWVNRNIKFFGGNDKSITIMGHGSGAVSASLHLTSGDWSTDLFHKAIIMSGTSLSATSVREPRTYAGSLDQLSSAFGCFRRPTADLLGCLRRVDAQILMENSPVMDWGPVIDEGLSNITTPFVSGDPRTLFERGRALKVPVLIGFTDMEDSLDVSMGEVMNDGIASEMYNSFIEDIVLNGISSLESNESCGTNNQVVMDAVNFVYLPYPPVTDPIELRKRFIDFNTERNYAAPTILLATYMSKMSETYVYKFDIKPKTTAANEGLPQWASVPHRYDQIFVWGLPYWMQLENQTQWDNADKRLSDIIMTLWSNFVKYTEPTKLGVYIKWDPFTPQQQGVLIIDRSFNMSDSTSLNYNAMQFWNDYYPKVIEFASQCCNATDTGSSIHTFVNNGSSRIIVLFLSILFVYQTVYLST
ncbi:hypothetical protein HA402_010851, partial [Bradysia odoriphaga]